MGGSGTGTYMTPMTDAGDLCGTLASGRCKSVVELEWKFYVDDVLRADLAADPGLLRGP